MSQIISLTAEDSKTIYPIDKDLIKKFSDLIAAEIKKGDPDDLVERDMDRIDLKMPEKYLIQVLDYVKHHSKEEAGMVQKQLVENITLEKNYKDKWDVEFLSKIDDLVKFYNSVEYLKMSELKTKISYYILMTEFKDIKLTDTEKIAEKMKKYATPIPQEIDELANQIKKLEIL